MSDGLRAKPDSLGRSERGGAGGAAQHPPSKRELYLDAFRGLMALVMVQGHVMDTLLTRAALAEPLYVWQQILHGSTAPGFLFASGFVAGLPRAPLSLRAGLRRARRLLFVLGVGYYLHLPYFSLWKTLGASTSAERALLFACDALQVIAATQLFVLVLQWLAGTTWTRWAGVLALAVVGATPFVWASGLAARLPEALAPWLDEATGSRFPVFPFSAFVLAGTLAGARLGHAAADGRHRLEIATGAGLLLVGGVLALVLRGRVDFWGPSPAYVLMRLGALLLLLRVVEAATTRGLPGIRALALLGHETLLVYVLHLTLLFGGVSGPSPLTAWHGTLGFAGATGVVVLMIPVLLAAAWLWRTAKRAPHEAQLALVFVTLAFLYEFAVRPW
ncbi:MAG TPA: heparan-alpha-glucosaminide N-acetyltransferase domain-containing protein [Vicinamibacteria bacterium]|nr:heparan-alpha-glucosaminide N-acetyltransferase domain-containing protein [Vicinamibacteria bacterium]